MRKVLDRPGAAIHVEITRQVDARAAEPAEISGKNDGVAALAKRNVRE